MEIVAISPGCGLFSVMQDSTELLERVIRLIGTCTDKFLFKWFENRSVSQVFLSACTLDGLISVLGDPCGSVSLGVADVVELATNLSSVSLG